jgi:hypothetical protein
VCATDAALLLTGSLAAGPNCAQFRVAVETSASRTFDTVKYLAVRLGTLSTLATCINKGAHTSKTETTGEYAHDSDSEAGFLVKVAGKKTVTESYQAVNYPHEPAQQPAYCVNDVGQIVGTYQDGSGVFHGYERSGGRFTTLNVPFAGATATLPQSINNSGEVVVGGWDDSDGNEHGFTLIAGTYASFDFPGGTRPMLPMSTARGTWVGYLDASGVWAAPLNTSVVSGLRTRRVRRPCRDAAERCSATVAKGRGRAAVAFVRRSGWKAAGLSGVAPEGHVSRDRQEMRRIQISRIERNVL